MSQETIERVYTINLGKVLLSPDNRRAKRAINMIREFAIRHMKSENVKIEEDVSHLVWARGIRHPPRKIRVKLTKDDDGSVLISKYQEEKPKEETEKKSKTKKTEKVEEKPKETIEKPEEPKPEKKSETKEKPKAEATPAKQKKEEKTKTKSTAKPKKK